MLRSLRLLAASAAIAALPMAAHAQDKPLTVKQVAKNVQSEVHRAGARTRDAAHKAGRQTNVQAKRTGKSVARVVSGDARNGDYSGESLKGPSAKLDKPVTPKEVGLTVSGDAKRAAAQTKNQTKRTAKSLKKIVSRKARHDSTE